ncbi:hypothetical protein [Pseudooceanicola nitratireducens]|uniref:hypothetical protein n=1 Tax=Pseudooceanicola nitratireducens TaxID=517719 RepID=UPI0023F04FED|nr:hypothetical protein [Pseudooceanicola nitratireducens]
MSWTAKALRRSPQNSCARERKAKARMARRHPHSTYVRAFFIMRTIRPNQADRKSFRSEPVSGHTSHFEPSETNDRDRADRFPRGWWLAPLLGLSACLQIAIAFGRFW